MGADGLETGPIGREDYQRSQDDINQPQAGEGELPMLNIETKPYSGLIETVPPSTGGSLPSFAAYWDAHTPKAQPVGGEVYSFPPDFAQ